MALFSIIKPARKQTTSQHRGTSRVVIYLLLHHTAPYTISNVLQRSYIMQHHSCISTDTWVASFLGVIMGWSFSFILLCLEPWTKIAILQWPCAKETDLFKSFKRFLKVNVTGWGDWFFFLGGGECTFYQVERDRNKVLLTRIKRGFPAAWGDVLYLRGQICGTGSSRKQTGCIQLYVTSDTQAILLVLFGVNWYYNN